jgi:23S rRNA U2552 (ribose-2'-O)-methylase RlmE/FtsJ
MPTLESFFNQNTGPLIHKWVHYFDIYERHFARFKGKEIVMLEIGVSQGGSLQMWKHYFGDKVKLYGIDINPECKQFEDEQVTIFIGSQSDRKFLRVVRAKIPPIDILIDDGGHTMKQQIVTFEELFDHVKSDGVYICEDLLTSYYLKYGGGYKRRGTFIEYSKNFIDSINAWYANPRQLKVNNFTRSVESLHYYNSMLVIEKRVQEKPYALKKGKPSFDDSEQYAEDSGVKSKLIYLLNYCMRFLGLPNIT